MMKTMLASGIIAGTMLLGSTAFAGYSGPHAGETALRPPRMAVAMTYQMPDDAPVTLEGVIVNRRKADRYTFRDRSGETVIEVREKAWKGVDANDRTLVRLFGKVDRKGHNSMIEVEKIELAQRKKQSMKKNKGDCR